MIYLFEAIWWAFCLILYVIWIPVAVILGIWIIVRIPGWISRIIKKLNEDD